MLDITDKKYFSYHITQRFLLAMDRVLANRSNGKVTAQAFGDVVGIKSSNLNRLRETTGENSVTVEACARLCDHYKISANWLITGEGEMMSIADIKATCEALDKRVTELEDIVDGIQLMVNQSKNSKKRG